MRFDGSSSVPSFGFDARLGRYRYADTGRLAPRSAVQNLRAKYIKQLEKEAITSFDKVLSREISFISWQIEFAESIRTLHIQNAIIGKGGVDRMTDADYLAVARELKDIHYPRFRAFAQDMKIGKLSEAQAKARLRLYLRAARNSHNTAAEKVAVSQGATYARRELHATISCPDCVRFAAMGIRKVGDLPLPSQQCLCSSNCRCEMVYFKSLADAVKNVAIARLS